MFYFKSALVQLEFGLFGEGLSYICAYKGRYMPRRYQKIAKVSYCVVSWKARELEKGETEEIRLKQRQFRRNIIQGLDCRKAFSSLLSASFLVRLFILRLFLNTELDRCLKEEMH